MKHLTGIIFLALAIFAFQLSTAAAEPSKIGVVVLQRCIQESNEGKRLADSLNKKKDEMQEELKKKDQELRDMQNDLEKQSLMLSEDAKRERVQEYDKKKRELGYLAQDMSDEFKQLQTSAQNDLMKLILGVVDKVAKDKKYDLITEGGSTLYFAKGMDITDEIIAELNKVKP